MNTPVSEPEQLIVALRPSTRLLVVPALLLVLLVGAILWLTGIFTETWMTWIIVLAGLLGFVLGCAIPFVSWLARRYTITSRKLIVQHGVFVRVRRELLHSRGYEVTVRRRLLQTLFRSGDVRINTAATELPIDLTDVPNPVLVQAVLQDLVEGNAGAAEALIASHGAHTTDATKRFDPNLLDDTQAL